jgi:hypothetical protein
MSLRAILCGTAVVASLFVFSGCQPVDAAIDCSTICNRYKTCFDGSYDTSACESRCRANSNSDNKFYNSVNTCEACITDRACASATFSCAGDCSKVVP